MMDADRPLEAASKVRFRREYFGGLAWTQVPQQFFRLGPSASSVFLLHLHPRIGSLTSEEEDALLETLCLNQTEWTELRRNLLEQHVLKISPGFETRSLQGDAIAVRTYLDRTTIELPLSKPFWVHMQPFTRCNQRCIHCYCNGGPEGETLQLPVATWREIVAKLDDYGIMDVYVTGGESLLYGEFFEIAEEILSRNLGFGVSTNASIVTDRILERIGSLGIKIIQVSLDGATASTHDSIRGTPGTFVRTINGIKRLSEVCSPVINTVVNEINYHELESIVKLGLTLGVGKFKFFPQKHAGRSLESNSVVPTDRFILEELIPLCKELSTKYAVEVETIDREKPCGSGHSGFAINQRGDIFPCIFGIEQYHQKCGNILDSEIDDVWFHSDVLSSFRNERSIPCHRCEK